MITIKTYVLRKRFNFLWPDDYIEIEYEDLLKDAIRLSMDCDDTLGSVSIKYNEQVLIDGILFHYIVRFWKVVPDIIQEYVTEDKGLLIFYGLPWKMSIERKGNTAQVVFSRYKTGKGYITTEAVLPEKELFMALISEALRFLPLVIKYRPDEPELLKRVTRSLNLAKELKSKFTE